MAEWLSTKDTANLLGISVGTLHNWCCAGRLSFYKPGRARMFKREDIDSFIEKTRREAV